MLRWSHLTALTLVVSLAASTTSAVETHELIPADAPAERAASPTRLVAAAALTAPLVLLAMISGLHFDGWQWLALALATPVVLWSAWPFHRAALLNARHGVATMDKPTQFYVLGRFEYGDESVDFGDVNIDSDLVVGVREREASS